MIEYPFDKRFLENIVARFVYPTSNIIETKKQLGSMVFSWQLTNGSMPFDKLMTSYALTLFGINAGVNVSSFESQNGLGGFYNNDQNLLSVNKNNAENKENMHRTMETIFHEICHKKQFETNAQAKYFGPMQNNHIGFFDNHFTKFMGEDFRLYYFLNPSEIEAGLTGTQNAIDLLKDISKDYENFSKDFEKFINSKIYELYMTKREFESFVAKSQSIFAGNLNSFYNKTDSLFERYYSSYNNLAKGTFKEKDEQNLQTIKSVFCDASSSSKIVNFIWALSSICAHFPKRENIAKVLDTSYELGPQTTAAVFSSLGLNRIPLSKSDFTKFFLQTSFDKEYLKSLGKNIDVFSFIDETALAKGMVMGGGVYRATSAVEYLKQSPYSKNIDFEAVQNEINKHSKEPILQVAGHNVFGCYDIVNIAMNKYCFEHPDFEEDPNKLMLLRRECIHNLGTIVQNCNGEINNNPKFLMQVAGFFDNPLEYIEEENLETISEKSPMFTEYIADKLEGVIEQKRDQSGGQDSNVDVPKKQGEESFMEKVFNFFVKKSSSQIYPPKQPLENEENLQQNPKEQGDV